MSRITAVSVISMMSRSPTPACAFSMPASPFHQFGSVVEADDTLTLARSDGAALIYCTTISSTR
jgi:hypothetical protein